MTVTRAASFSIAVSLDLNEIPWPGSGRDPLTEAILKLSRSNQYAPTADVNDPGAGPAPGVGGTRACAKNERRRGATPTRPDGSAARVRSAIGNCNTAKRDDAERDQKEIPSPRSIRGRLLRSSVSTLT